MYNGYYYGFDTTYLLLVVPALLIALIAQIQVKSAFSRYARVRCTSGLTGAQARMLFENVWIYTFGVGALCATRVCSFSQQQLGQMLTTQFQGMMMLIKSGNYPSNGQGN